MGTWLKAVREDKTFHSIPGAKVGKQGANKERLISPLLRKSFFKPEKYHALKKPEWHDLGFLRVERKGCAVKHSEITK